MTLQELYQFTYLMKEVDLLKEEKQGLEWAFENLRTYESEVVADTVMGSSADFPYTKHPIAIAGMEIDAAQLLEYDTQVKRLRELPGLLGDRIGMCLEEYARLLWFIDSIPDSLTRSIFTLRFTKRLPWDAVAAKVGGGNTAESVRKICERYAGKNDSCPICPVEK